MQKTTSCFFPSLVWFVVILSFLWQPNLLLAAKTQVKTPKINGFAAWMRENEFPPVSISFVRDSEKTANAKEKLSSPLEQARQMLIELDGAATTVSNKSLSLAEDILAFQKWCLQAPGGGNLALAISAEEIVVTLLFDELAKNTGEANMVQSTLREFLQNRITANYWIASLSIEGIECAPHIGQNQDASEYLRLESILSFINQNYANMYATPLFPKTNWPRKGCLDEFNPYALTWRSLMLERKIIALEACLAIQDALENIPDDSKTFHEVADKYAGAILGNSERLTSWMTPNEAWDYWAAALEESEKDLTDLREDEAWASNDDATDTSSPLTEP